MDGLPTLLASTVIIFVPPPDTFGPTQIVFKKDLTFYCDQCAVGCGPETDVPGIFDALAGVGWVPGSVGGANYHAKA